MHLSTQLLAKKYYWAGNALGIVDITENEEPSVSAFKTLHPADEMDIQQRVIQCLWQGQWESNPVRSGVRKASFKRKQLRKSQKRKKKKR